MTPLTPQCHKLATLHVQREMINNFIEWLQDRRQPTDVMNIRDCDVMDYLGINEVEMEKEVERLWRCANFMKCFEEFE